jgi:hypothetical protein
MKRVSNLKAEQLVQVLDLYGAGAEEEEEKFIAASKMSAKTNRAFDVRYTVCENIHGEGYDITDSEGNDCFYNVEISEQELKDLAEMPGAEFEEFE